jgi:hypothetical protein
MHMVIILGLLSQQISLYLHQPLVGCIHGQVLDVLDLGLVYIWRIIPRCVSLHNKSRAELLVIVRFLSHLFLRTEEQIPHIYDLFPHVYSI